MQHADTVRLSPNISALFNRVIHFFGRSRISTHQSERVLGNIDWHDSDTDFKQPCHGTYKQPISGGYNEAFIIRYWTSYHLR